MIRIELTDKYYVVKSDDLNWKLIRKVVIENGKRIGEVREETAFYYPTLLQCLVDTVKILAEEEGSATTVQEYIADLFEAQTTIEAALAKQCKALKLS
jgi:hypothetical protein